MIVWLIALMVLATGALFFFAFWSTADPVPESTRSSAATDLPERVRPTDVGDVRFDNVVRGYRMDQVDRTLDKLSDELAIRDRELAQARSELVRLGAAAPVERDALREPVDDEPVLTRRTRSEHLDPDRTELVPGDDALVRPRTREIRTATTAEELAATSVPVADGVAPDADGVTVTPDDRTTAGVDRTVAPEAQGQRRTFGLRRRRDEA